MPNTEEYIGVVISDVARLLRTEFDRRVRRLGITRGQWLVLTLPPAPPARRVALRTRRNDGSRKGHRRPHDRPARCERLGQRRAERDDRRVKRVYLTADAERVHKRIWRVAENRLSARSPISRRESKQLFALLQRVEERWFPAPTVRQKVRLSSRGEIRSRGMRRLNGRISS